MKRFPAVLAIVSFCMIAGISTKTPAQARLFTSEAVEYTFELPSPVWRIISEPDGINQHAEFIFGDRNDGFLQIHKEVVESGVSPTDLARRDQDQRLRFRPGFIEGKQERFAARFPSVALSYEYTSGGKPMSGVIYYLQTDSHTIYALRFSGLRDKLRVIRNQTDEMARTFRLK